MSVYLLKSRFQSLLRPLVGVLFGLGVTANQVTLAACACSIAIGFLLLLNLQSLALFLAIPVWMLVRMALNAIDGMLAREFGQKSQLGAYLNELTDVVSDAALYAPFALLQGFSIASVATVIFLSGLAEMAGVVAATTGASRRYDGPMGKSDRALVFGVLGLWIGCGIAVPSWFDTVMWVVAALAGITVINRIRCGLREAAEGKT